MASKTVAGVQLSKVKPELINQALEKVGIEVTADLAQNIKNLSDYFATKPSDELVKCDGCEGVSSISFDECPYCGMSDQPPEGVTVKTPEPKQDKPEAKPKGKKKAPVTPETTTALAKVSPATMSKPKKGGAIHDAEIIPQGTIADLDQSVAAIQEAKGNAAKSHWTIGKLIAENHTKALWKLRTDAEGKSLYSSFNAFCENELKISPAHAYNLMDIARAFNEEQVMKFGPSKLGLLLQVPPEDQAQLLAIAETASKRQLQKQVDATKEKNKKEGKAAPVKEGRKKDVSKATAKSGAAGKGAPATTGTSKKDVITIASITGNKTVKLFATPAKKGDTPKEAKKLADEPWGRLELENNVEMFFKLKPNAGGHLTLQISTRRIEKLGVS